MPQVPNFDFMLIKIYGLHLNSTCNIDGKLSMVYVYLLLILVVEIVDSVTKK